MLAHYPEKSTGMANVCCSVFIMHIYACMYVWVCVCEAKLIKDTYSFGAERTNGKQIHGESLGLINITFFRFSYKM